MSKSKHRNRRGIEAQKEKTKKANKILSPLNFIYSVITALISFLSNAPNISDFTFALLGFFVIVGIILGLLYMTIKESKLFVIANIFILILTSIFLAIVLFINNQ